MTSCGLLAHNVYAKARPDTSARAVFKLSRALVFVITLLALFLALVAHSLIVTILLVAYDFIAQLLPVVVIGGLFWRRGTLAGAFSGLATGWTLSVIFLFSGHSTVGGMNAGFVALVANICAYVVVSLLTTPVESDVLDRHFGAISRDPGNVVHSVPAE